MNLQTLVDAQKEINRLRADNQRLRWRHPNTLPGFNDLPDELRSELRRIGEQMIDPHTGADAVIRVYGEVRKALSEVRP